MVSDRKIQFHIEKITIHSLAITNHLQSIKLICKFFFCSTWKFSWKWLFVIRLMRFYINWASITERAIKTFRQLSEINVVKWELVLKYPKRWDLEIFLEFFLFCYFFKSWFISRNLHKLSSASANFFKNFILWRFWNSGNFDFINFINKMNKSSILFLLSKVSKNRCVNMSCRINQRRHQSFLKFFWQLKTKHLKT